MFPTKAVQPKPETVAAMMSVRDLSERIVQVTEKALAGKFISVACRENNVPVRYFREFLKFTEKLAGDMPPAPTAKFSDLLTPHEKFYFEIMETDPDTAAYMPPDVRANLEAAMDTLSDREKAIVRAMSLEDEPVSEIAREWSVTQERVRQIYAKARRKLRHPARKQILMYGPGIDMAARRAELIAAGREKIQKDMDDMREAASDVVRAGSVSDEQLDAVIRAVERMRGNTSGKADAVIKDGADALTLLTMPVADLPLSTRTMRAVSRGYPYRLETLSDFIGKTRKDILRIRNLGVKSADELIQVLLSYGIEIPDE